jgi:hypothetical protein
MDKTEKEIRISSPSGFRSNLAVFLNMSKDHARPVNQSIPDKLKPIIKKILHGQGWGEHKEAAQQAVALSIQNYRRIHSKLYDLSKSPGATMKRRAERLLDKLTNEVGFLRAWFIKLHSKLFGWSDWGGHFKGHQFDPANNYTNNWFLKALVEYAGQASGVQAWKEIKEKL